MSDLSDILREEMKDVCRHDAPVDLILQCADSLDRKEAALRQARFWFEAALIDGITDNDCKNQIAAIDAALNT